MQKLDLKSNRSFRVNLVSMLAGLMAFGLFVFVSIGLHYNLFGLFEETKDSYTRTTFIGILSMFAIFIYIILNLALLINSIFADSEETRLIDGNLIKVYFEVVDKTYFNWDVYIISSFPIVLLLSILVNWLKSQYIKYIDE